MANSYDKMSADNATIVDAYSRMQKRIQEEKEAEIAAQRDLDNNVLSEEKGYPFKIKKGAFHKWLGKDEDEPITNADIEKGLNSDDEHARKMAQFAKNSRTFHHKESVEEVTEAKDGKKKKVEKDLEKIADELEEGKKSKDIKKVEKEIEDQIDKLEETKDSEYSANKGMSGDDKPGFYLKKGDKRISDRHETMDHAMKKYKELTDVERKGCKIVNESMEDMMITEAIMNPEHDEKDQVMLKKLHKLLPELGLKKADHVESHKSGEKSYNGYSVKQPIPAHLEHMFKDLRVDFNTSHNNDDDSHHGSLDYVGKNRNGVPTATHIGVITFNGKTGKHTFHHADAMKDSETL